MEEVRPHEDPQFDQDIANLATKAASRVPLVVREGRPPGSRGLIYWMALLLPVTLGSIGFGLLWESHPAASPSSSSQAIDAPGAAPTRVVAASEGNPCATRMGLIMQAIVTYRAQHGTAPLALTDLVPDYLSEPPVDPATTQPYLYEAGESVTVRCPNAQAHVPVVQVPPS